MWIGWTSVTSPLTTAEASMAKKITIGSAYAIAELNNYGIREVNLRIILALAMRRTIPNSLLKFLPETFVA